MRRGVAIGFLAALSLLAVHPASALTIYNVDVSSPTHTVGSAPTLGSGATPRDTPSSLLQSNGATAKVVTGFGALSDQPAQLATHPTLGCLSSCVTSLVFSVTDGGLILQGRYEVSFDLVVGAGTLGNGAAIFAADLGSSLLVRFESDGTITAGPAVSQVSIGSYALGDLLSVDVVIDLVNLSWTVAVDDALLFTSPNLDTSLTRFRLTGGANGIIQPGSRFDLAYDNVVISAPEPATLPLLLVAGIAGLVATRRRA